MAQTFARQVADRFPLRLGTPQLKAVAALSAPENLTVTGSTLAPFLVPRVSGTEGNKNVQKHIIDTFTELGWGIEQDQFSDSTPFGVKHFNNIIVTKDPAALRKLVLAAHFDSKYFEEFEFIGATDSSVPCAILVDIAKTINELLQEKIMSGDRFATIQIIFFDGEEAFVKWTDTDSIYGSRHLAKKWSETQLLTNSDPSLHLMNSHDPSGQYYTTPIKQIDAMVLLDLLGAPKSSIPNTHPETSWIWDRLVDIQTRLAENDILSQALRDRINNPNDQGIFLPGLSTYLTPHSIQDDHVPFYSLGVPVVHCIPVPFPKEWHTEFDNSNAISADTVHDLALIFRTFVIEYLGLLLHKP
ncbi:hypothetical protein BASA50_011331 [Batrachochytrium salamandrivorans]|uniref:Peptide hydrolase n=1 Tax=Batrachochytrium salamandrivorans TaxID=1357716 RepID=A0ABQ8EWX9_9FUNG|nr:hypothetical protein BASA60_007818 [Batrachochytrium salamandrivorans]KAH6573425.1 hypothetical protein BASA62_002952 [Batrachochytrium salamandrivorans]KAH6587727.1 hypothetical protein BASA50_011331 [Batrachochytrium salamandrivorans]